MMDTGPVKPRESNEPRLLASFWGQINDGKTLILADRTSEEDTALWHEGGAYRGVVRGQSLCINGAVGSSTFNWHPAFVELIKQVEAIESDLVASPRWIMKEEVR